MAEDLGLEKIGDVTTLATVPEDARAQARVELRQPAMIAGLTIFQSVMQELDRDLNLDFLCREGDRVAGTPCDILRVTGNARAILTAERLALNLLQRMSAIATMTGRFVEKARGSGIEILHTRKTTPGLRAFERYAVLVGGGSLHRAGLYDRVLIKENHITMAGSVAEAVMRSRKAWPALIVEIETRTLAEVEEAVEAGADIILLDNMKPDQVREAVRLVAGAGRLEVSGGINLDNLDSYLIQGIDYISVGALTHSVPAVDMSLILD
ncbi:MAG: carboxylating nicotinate-nucleotide diphosphorylase [Cyanobacteria bacterium HKST-UBA02]|nr:carboxylating nicotinate-nucleotide diphosphorylase [Cyanobacteria bacterium HKST-UBA02]